MTFGIGVSGMFTEEAAAAIRVANLFPFLTGAFGMCPFYLLVGANTRRLRSGFRYLRHDTAARM